MATTMRTRIIKIGNSQGIRIPKILLEQSNLGREVELEVVNNQIIIRAQRQPREGWATAFAAMAESGSDALLDEALLSTKWDEDEWEW